MRYEELTIEGRNAVMEAFRSAKRPLTSCLCQDGCQDGPVRTIVREAKKTRLHHQLCGKGAAGSDV